MSPLTLFGMLAVSAMLVFYALEDRSRVFVLLFAAACAASSVYGFLQGRGRSASSKSSGRGSPCGAGTSDLSCGPIRNRGPSRAT
jgi:hypothetical protein